MYIYICIHVFAVVVSSFLFFCGIGIYINRAIAPWRCDLTPAEFDCGACRLSPHSSCSSQWTLPRRPV